MYIIEPLTIWVNGVNTTVTRFNTYGVEDNLINGTAGFAKFAWFLGTATQQEGEPEAVNFVISGNVVMDGENYANWDDSNAAAVAFVASQLGVKIVTSPGMIATEVPLKLATHLPQ